MTIQTSHLTSTTPAAGTQADQTVSPVVALGWLHTAKFLTTAPQLHFLPALQVPEIAFVGRSNAGKSTLFNALVKARAYAADQLFATLDTTTRQLYLGDAQRSVSLSDTVGFIRDLPHGLVDAFAATLQEAADADLLLHVVDASNADYLEQIEQVQRVLLEIGAENVPQILVFNKLDAIEKTSWPLHMHDMFELRDAFEESSRSAERVFVSAKTGEGLSLLRELLAIQGSRVQAGDSPQTPQ